MRQRLLTITVQSPPHGPQRSWGVHVVGRADDHGVEFLLLDHLAEVAIAGRLGELLKGPLRRAIVRIAQSHDVLAPDSLQVVKPPTTGANDTDVELLIRRRS